MRRETAECLETGDEVEHSEDVSLAPTTPFVAVVVVAFDGCVIDRPVHPIDLVVRPRMGGLGEPVLDPILAS